MPDRLPRKFPKIRRVLLIALRSVVAVTTLLRPLSSQSPQAPLSPVLYEAPVGKTTHELLPEKTKMTLAPGTKVFVWFDGKTRRVRVIGEAWFEVVHDPSRPFFVCGSGRLFGDLGTSFNILALSSSVTVTVAEGQVRPGEECGDTGEFSPPLQHPWYAIWTKDEPLEPPVGAKQQITIVLTPEGSIETRRGPVTDQQLEDIKAWQRGQIVFRNVALPDALTIMNRYLKQQLRMADQSLASERLSGTMVYKDSTTDSIVSALRACDEQIISRRDPAGPDVIELVRRSRDVKESR